MIRNVLVVGEHGRLVYSYDYCCGDAKETNVEGMGALVSVVHNIIPLLTGSSIKKIKIDEENLLIHAHENLVFAISVEGQVTEEYEKKLDFVVEKFTSHYEGIIPFLDENTDLEVFNDFTNVLNESNMFP